MLSTTRPELPVREGEEGQPVDQDDPDDPVVEEIAEIVKALGSRMRAHFGYCVSDVGLTPPQAMALLGLETPKPMGALADEMALDASYITDIADQLEGRHLVARKPDPADRRRKILVLTPDGEMLRAGLERRLRGPDAPTVAGLSKSEKCELRDLLRKVMESVDAQLPILAAGARPGKFPPILKPAD